MRRWLILAGLTWGLAFAPVAMAQTTEAPSEAQPPAVMLSPGPLVPAPAGMRGDYFVYRSAEVDREFHIYVRYPEGYDPAAVRTYPTVYLTDGDALFPLLSVSHLFIHYDDGLPEALVVGVAYGSFDRSVNRRFDDYSPPGAEAFQRFFKSELIPEVERRYRSDPARRILFGQSRGGQFVLYSAVADPDLFWGRIASNPAITPGREPLFQPAAEATRDDLGLVLVSGSRDRPDLRQEAADWTAAWAGNLAAPWAVHSVVLDGATHAADVARIYRLGMNWLFRDRGAAATH